MRPNNKLEGKYSLKSTDPRESAHIDDADLDVSDTCVRNSLLSELRMYYLFIIRQLICLFTLENSLVYGVNSRAVNSTPG